MNEGSKPGLLWIDDDGPDRFPYEERQLRKSGWEVTWSASAKKGAEALCAQDFQVILLDQMLPWEAHQRGKEELWAGCFLFYWLRGKGRPPKAPPRKPFDSLVKLRPHPKNTGAQVIVISAFYDDDVAMAFRSLDPSLQELTKPVHFERLRSLLSGLRTGG